MSIFYFCFVKIFMPTSVVDFSVQQYIQKIMKIFHYLRKIRSLFYVHKKWTPRVKSWTFVEIMNESLKNDLTLMGRTPFLNYQQRSW